MDEKEILVVSDIHLASEVSKAKELRKFLEQKEKEISKIIILGDLFDHANFKRLRKQHWKLLTTLREFSSKGIEIVWVEGNHDLFVIDIVSHMIGAKVISQKEHYEIERGENKIALIHGHQFDTFIADVRWWLLALFATKMYSLVQKIDNKDYTLSRFLKKQSKLLLHVSKANSMAALEYAEKKKIKTIICGHVHLSCTVKKGEAVYINTGSWVDSVCHYVLIDKEGECHLKELQVDKNDIE